MATLSCCIYNTSCVTLIMQKKDSIDEIDVINCVNLRLRMLTRITNKLYADPLREIGISPCQQNIVFMVGKMKRVPQNELGRMLFLERSTVTRELSGLMTKGFIRKSDDFPSPVIELTKSGVALLKVIIPIWSTVQRGVLKDIGDAGSKAIDMLLNSLKKEG